MRTRYTIASRFTFTGDARHGAKGQRNSYCERLTASPPSFLVRQHRSFLYWQYVAISQTATGSATSQRGATSADHDRDQQARSIGGAQ